MRVIIVQINQPSTISIAISKLFATEKQRTTKFSVSLFTNLLLDDAMETEIDEDVFAKIRAIADILRLDIEMDKL